MKEGYKKTELGWVPEEWEVKEIGKCSNVTKLAGFEFTEYINYVDDGEVIALRALNLKNGKLDLTDIKRIYRSVSENLTRSKLYNGDILFSYVGTVGEVAMIEENDKYHLAPNVAKLTFNSSVYPKYIYQYMRDIKLKNEITKYVTTTSQPALSMENIRKMKVIIPPLEEQQKISEILSTVDSQIDDTDKFIEKTKELKKGLMQQLLTKGIGHKEFKKTEIGEIPVEWEVKDINSCANVTKLAGFEFTEYMSYIDSGEIIALRALNLKNGKLNLNDIKRIDRKVSDSLLRSKLFIGDLLFSYVGTVGEVALINENDRFHLAPNVAKIRFNDNILPEYALQYMMCSNLKNEINKYVTTTSQPALSMENIRKMKFFIPTLLEQKQIVNVLSSIDTDIQEYENKKAKLEELKKGLMQQLLSGKVRVI